MSGESRQASGAGVLVRKPTLTSVKQHLVVEGARISEAVKFMEEAFGAVQGPTKHEMYEGVQQGIVLVELLIGKAKFVVATDDVVPVGMKPVGQIGNVILLETTNIKASKLKARAAVANSTEPNAYSFDPIDDVDDGAPLKLKDPFGNLWIISSSLQA